MRDLKNNIDLAPSIAPATYNADADGTGVDLKGFMAAVIAFHPGTITDGTHAPKIQESDDDVTYTDVPADDQEGTLSNLATDTLQRVGYKGGKRYVKAFVTVTPGVTGGIYAAEVIRGLPASAPVA